MTQRNDNEPLIPIKGSDERMVLDRLREGPATFLDFPGMTEERLAQIVENLKNGMFIAENDSEVKLDD